VAARKRRSTTSLGAKYTYIAFIAEASVSEEGGGVEFLLPQKQVRERWYLSALEIPEEKLTIQYRASLNLKKNTK